MRIQKCGRIVRRLVTVQAAEFGELHSSGSHQKSRGCLEPDPADSRRKEALVKLVVMDSMVLCVFLKFPKPFFNLRRVRFGDADAKPTSLSEKHLA